MPGPAPKHPSVRARRNNPKADFRSLPAGGRTGAVPTWPLQPLPRLAAELEYAEDQIASLQVKIAEETDGRAKGRMRRDLARFEMTCAERRLQIEQTTDAEVALWADLWHTPQAVVWEESRSQREVAQYVRWKIAAEQGNLDAAKEARMLSDRLGLNPLALLRLRTEIEHAEEAEARGRQRRGSTPPTAKGPDGDDPRGGLYAVS